jgi:hypothetical protein
MELLSCRQHTQLTGGVMCIFITLSFLNHDSIIRKIINIKTYLHKMCDNMILKLIYTVDVQIVSVVPVGNYSLHVLNFINSVCVSSIHGV